MPSPGKRKVSRCSIPKNSWQNWRTQMTPVERDSLKNESVIGTVSQNLLEGPVAKNLALEHLLERASVARCASRRRYEETTPLVFLNPNSLRTFTIVSASTMLVAAAVKIVPRQDVWL